MRRATRDRSQKKGTRRRYGGGTIAVVGIVAIAALWVIYWYGASQIGAAILDRVAAAAAARGYEARCEDSAGGGFPLHVNLSCSRASLADTDRGLSAVIEGFSAKTPLYRPWRVDSEALGPLLVELPPGQSDLAAHWRSAETSLDAGLDGLSGAAASVEELRVDLPAGANPSPFEGMTIASADVSVFPDGGSDYRLSAMVRAVILETQDGEMLPEIDLTAGLTAIELGATLGLDPRRTLRDWLAGGGSLRIDELEVATEAVSTSTSGSLAVSREGKLSGDLDVTIAGIEALPDVIETFRPGARDQVVQVVAAVTAFTRPVELPDGPARQMTLLVRDGVVSIGILPIAVIPPIPM